MDTFARNSGVQWIELMALDMAHKRELKNMSRDAQAVIDSLEREIVRLRGEVRKANAEIARERGARIAIAHRLDQILDMEI